MVEWLIGLTTIYWAPLVLALVAGLASGWVKAGKDAGGSK
ncbi:hypothetical protein [Devosia sp. DBB001]|nr:hypothetical protein [Devosia sp. DBB001]